MKRILIIGLLFLASINNVSALTLDYNNNGTGTWQVLSGYSASGCIATTENIRYINNRGAPVYTAYTACGTCIRYYHSYGRMKTYTYKNSGTHTTEGTFDIGECTSGNWTIPDNQYYKVKIDANYLTAWNGNIYLTVSDYPLTKHTVSGVCGCLDWVKLYIKDANDNYIYLFEDTTPNTYSFNILNDSSYRLHFSDDTFYDFKCNGSKIYNYNICSYMTINLQDYCGNTMANTSVDIYKSDGGNMESYEFVGTYLRINPIQILIDTDIEEGKMLDIYMDTNMGAYHVIDYCEEKTISILHPSKYWTMSFGAFDIDTKAPIENMRITMNQSCVIDPLHPLKQYLFTGEDGYGTFIGLSGDKIDVMQGHPDYTGKAGYTNFFINIPCDAFQTAYSIDTFFNKSDSHETEDYDDEIDNVTDECSIWFEDSQGSKTNRIDDLDAYVDLYYVNNCTDTTLKFQSEEYGYWSALQSWSISAGDSGYKRIYNTDFANANAYYRGYMYSDDMEESTCDITLPLYVYNNMDEDIIDGCSIWYEDQTGKIDNHINDTDTYVDLYYKNSNCTSSLKFQRLYNTYWMTKQTFSISANEIGYKRIYNVDFNDVDANYRGYMYATSCSCDSTLSLYVTNQTIEEDQHYENLTAHCSFKHQLGDGQVDFRSPVEILAYAYSNTSHTLLNINLTLYNKTALIASKQCDWSDFAGATPKWFYVWSPNVNYGIGNNYTVIMTGYDGLKLDADTVWTSNKRNNKLTVNVIDNHNTPVTHSTVFVQGWGSQALGFESSFIVTGLQNQVYQYKATKPGYVSSGWASVNLTDEDKTVSCVLVEQETQSVTGYKLKEDEVKGFFIPLMYMLLIMILIGGLMNASKN